LIYQKATLLTIKKTKILLMRRIFFLMLVLLSFSMLSLTAQDTKTKQPSFGFQFSFIDFPTAADLRSGTLASVLDAKQWSKVSRMEPSLTVVYAQGLHPHVDFMSRMTGSFLRYPFRTKSEVVTEDRIYVEADATVNVKLLTDNYVVVPYLQAGVGAATTQSTFMAHIPLGVGLQIGVGRNTFINLNSNYRVPVTSPANYSLMHSFGVLTSIVNDKPVVAPKPLPPAPKPVAVPVDTDGDGLVDSLDACPDVAGLKELKGCPDADKDGITDKEDKCPNEAGIAKYGGCPIPDSDKDGINDETDKCPNEAGVERYEGCPVPDTDKDGLNDEEDKCPALAGTAAEMGCPAVDFKAGDILFNTGSAALSAKSKKSLDLLSKFLNENSDVKAYLGGHADNTGTEEKNTTISLERAQNAASYLTGKGVAAERITTQGYSASQPAEDNGTAQGRAKNRRVNVALKRY
jgi:outer membrane protein OmpA-like peptidoglycan-associated protein